MDSPYHPYSDTRFTINEKGADDIEEEGISKKSVGNKKGNKSTTTEEKLRNTIQIGIIMGRTKV